MNPIMYVLGGIVSAFSIYLTYRSWKDTREAFSMIGHLNSRIESLESSKCSCSCKKNKDMLLS